jgi:hypothetical protein
VLEDVYPSPFVGRGTCVSGVESAADMVGDALENTFATTTTDICDLCSVAVCSKWMTSTLV